jgi:hypothetical protein
MAFYALEGVVALVSCRADGYLDPTPSIHAKLRGMGARVAARLGKDVTHIIFNRRLNPTAQVSHTAPPFTPLNCFFVPLTVTYI